MLRLTPSSTLFPYTTLFRSRCSRASRFPLQDLRRGLWAIHGEGDRKSTRLNSSHANISYAVFCLKKKKDRHNGSYVSVGDGVEFVVVVGWMSSNSYIGIMDV